MDKRVQKLAIKVIMLALVLIFISGLIYLQFFYDPVVITVIEATEKSAKVTKIYHLKTGLTDYIVNPVENMGTGDPSELSTPDWENDKIERVCSTNMVDGILTETCTYKPTK